MSLQIFLDRFVNRYDRYLQAKDGKGWFSVEGTLDIELLKRHFAGEITLSVYATSKDDTCKWICWDYDGPNTIPLMRIEGFLKARGLFPMAEGARAGRAGHLWVFFDKPISVADARALGVYSKMLTNQDKEKCLEVFPKWEKGEVGTGVKLPLGLNRKLLPEKIRGMFRDGPEVPARQVQWFLDQPLSPSTKLTTWLATMPALAEVPKPVSRKPKGDLFALLPPKWPMKKKRDQYIGACPVCQREGHDETGNNLAISEDGKLMTCFWNEQAHSFDDIREAFAKLTDKSQLPVG